MPFKYVYVRLITFECSADACLLVTWAPTWQQIVPPSGSSRTGCFRPYQGLKSFRIIDSILKHGCTRPALSSKLASTQAAAAPAHIRPLCRSGYVATAARHRSLGLPYSVMMGPAEPAPRCNSSLKLAACSKGVGWLLPPGATAYPAGPQQPSKLFS